MNPLVRLDTSVDTPRILQAIHQTWLGKEPPDPEDAREVRDDFAYYYENFSEYTSKKIGLAEVDGEIVSLSSSEKGIPCVVGTEKATELIRNKMLIAVDGTTGEVKKIR